MGGIIYSTENGVYVVKEDKPGKFTVWVPGAVATVRKATFSFPADRAESLRRAIQKANDLAALTERMEP